MSNFRNVERDVELAFPSIEAARQAIVALQGWREICTSRGLEVDGRIGEDAIILFEEPDEFGVCSAPFSLSLEEWPSPIEEAFCNEAFDRFGAHWVGGGMMLNEPIHRDDVAMVEVVLAEETELQRRLQ